MLSAKADTLPRFPAGHDDRIRHLHSERFEHAEHDAFCPSSLNGFTLFTQVDTSCPLTSCTAVGAASSKSPQV